MACLTPSQCPGQDTPCQTRTCTSNVRSFGFQPMGTVLGIGPATSNPEYQAGWQWTNATYNVQSGDNDEYEATFTAPATGSYRYVYRMSVDGGVSWTYCDQNLNDGGAGRNPNLLFSFADEPVLTVTP